MVEGEHGPVDGQAHHGLLLPFDTDEMEFVRGFEIGRLWAILRERPDETIIETARAANAEMLLRLAEATRRHVIGEPVDDSWVVATFTPSGVVDSPI